MKIGILIDSPFLEGYIYPRRVEKLAKYMVDKGFEVIVYCKKEDELVGEEFRNGIKIKRVFDKFLGTTERIDFYLHSHIQLFNSIDKDLDLLFCVDTMTLPMGVLLKNLIGAKLIFDCYEYFPDYIERKWYGENERKYNFTKLLLEYRGEYLKEADIIIAVSDEMANKLYEKYHLDKKVEVLYNSEFKIQDTFKGNTLRKEFNLGNKKVVLFQGMIEESRGIEHLIQVVKYMQGFVLVLAGKIKPEYKMELMHLIDENAVSEQVIFTGYKSARELKEYTYEADCFIYAPYIRVENINVTLPNKIFDYIEAKKPIIVNEAISLKNLVETTGTGISLEFENCNYQKLAKQILEYIFEYDYKVVKYEKVAKKYSEESMYIEFDRILKEIISND
ncbi:MAG: glycosyltransferase family 4 protein [Sarcina sp.]